MHMTAGLENMKGVALVVASMSNSDVVVEASILDCMHFDMHCSFVDTPAHYRHSH